MCHKIFLYLVGNISAFQVENIFAFQEANFVSTVKPMFSDVGDTNVSATMILTFGQGFSLKKIFNPCELMFIFIYHILRPV